MFDFINPGKFGDKLEFKKYFSNSLYFAKYLEPYITPFILKRETEKVGIDLPQLDEQIIPIEFDDLSKKGYDDLRREKKNIRIR